MPDLLKVEKGMLDGNREAVDALHGRGHVIDAKGTRQGDAHSIGVGEDGVAVGVADKRRSGAVAPNTARNAE